MFVEKAKQSLTGSVKKVAAPSKPKVDHEAEERKRKAEEAARKAREEAERKAREAYEAALK